MEIRRGRKEAKMNIYGQCEGNKWNCTAADVHRESIARGRQTHLCSGARFSMKPITWSKRVANRFNEVTIPPFGPKPYCFITSLYFTVSRISVIGQHNRRTYLILLYDQPSNKQKRLLHLHNTDTTQYPRRRIG